MNKDEIVKTVLSDPELLWKIIKSGKQVLNKWEKAERIGVSYHNAMMRAASDGVERIIVSPSRKLENPDEHLYRYSYYENDEDETGYFEEESYERDMKDYLKELSIWKPWHFWTQHPFKRFQEYANTKEEAIELADKYLDSIGVLYLK